MKTFLLVMIIFFTNIVFAQPVPFEKIQDFHNDRVEVIKKNYGLEEDVDVSVLLSLNEMKSLNVFSKKQSIKLPGLLLGGIQVERDPATIGMFEIISDLSNYKREVTVVKKKQVSDEEIQALILSLKEHLSLRPDETVRVEDKSFKFDVAMKDWKTDLKKSLYESTFKSAAWTWVPVVLFVLSLLGFILSWALKSGLKTLGKSIENVDFSGDSIGAGGGVSNLSGDGLSDDAEFEEEVVVTSDPMFEADPIRIYQKFTSLYLKSKYELCRILWSHLPTPSLQFMFYQIMIQDFNESEETEFKSMYFSIFKIENGFDLSDIKAEELNSGVISQINKGISIAEMSEPVLVRERALAAIYPQYAGNLKIIIEKSLDSFFDVVFYLFPDEVVSVVKTKPYLSEVVSKRLPEILSLPSSSRIPTTERVQSFAELLEENEGFDNETANNDVSTQAMKLLISLNDSDLFNNQFLNTDSFKSIRDKIPSVNWVTDENPQVLRRFLTQLSVEEIGYMNSEHMDFRGLLDSLDSRAVIRIEESINRSMRSKQRVNIAMLRKKIASSFKAREDENELSQDDFYNAA